MIPANPSNAVLDWRWLCNISLSFFNYTTTIEISIRRNVVTYLFTL